MVPGMVVVTSKPGITATDLLEQYRWDKAARSKISFNHSYVTFPRSGENWMLENCCQLSLFRFFTVILGTSRRKICEFFLKNTPKTIKIYQVQNFLDGKLCRKVRNIKSCWIEDNKSREQLCHIFNEVIVFLDGKIPIFFFYYNA